VFTSVLSTVGAQLAREEEQKTEVSDFYHDIVLKTEAEFNNELEQLFEKLQPLIVEMMTRYPKLPEYITSSMVRAINQLNENALALMLEENSPSGSLILARIWLRFEKEGIPTFERRLRGLGDSLGLAHNFKGNKIDNAIKDIKDNVKDTAQQMLQYFVRYQGTKLGLILRNYIDETSWLNKPEPTKKEPLQVEDVIDKLISEIQSFNDYLLKMFSVSDDTNNNKSYVLKRPTNSQQGLFSYKLHLFGRIEFDRASILSAIVKLTIKTFLEYIRKTTFGKIGYQQIQLNVNYLKLIFKENGSWFDDKAPLLLMLDEIVDATEERSRNATQLDNHIIDKICKEKLKLLRK